MLYHFNFLPLLPRMKKNSTSQIFRNTESGTSIERILKTIKSNPENMLQRSNAQTELKNG